MKKIIIVILLLFITGCSSEYNLKISNNSFKENIKFIVENQNSNYDLSGNIELDDQLTPFLKEKTEAIQNKEKFYKKKIKQDNNFRYIEMKYKYSENDFKEANSINLCFEYPELDFSDNYYIHLQGQFYCLYSDSINIKIETKNKVYSNNADEINNGIYIWHINETNKDSVDIELEVDKGISIINIIGITIFTVIFGGIIFVCFLLINKRKKNNAI